MTSTPTNDHATGVQGDSSDAPSAKNVGPHSSYYNGLNPLDVEAECSKCGQTWQQMYDRLKATPSSTAPSTTAQSASVPSHDHCPPNPIPPWGPSGPSEGLHPTFHGHGPHSHGAVYSYHPLPGSGPPLDSAHYPAPGPPGPPGFDSTHYPAPGPPGPPGPYLHFSPPLPPGLNPTAYPPPPPGWPYGSPANGPDWHTGPYGAPGHFTHYTVTSPHGTQPPTSYYTTGAAPNSDNASSGSNPPSNPSSIAWSNPRANPGNM